MISPPPGPEKRVLLVATDFPPVGGTNIYRIVKFAKYLPSYGWIPSVVTVALPPSHRLDPSHLDELPPDMRILRSGSLDPFVILSFLRAPRKRERREATDAAAAGASQSREDGSGRKPGWLSRLSDHLFQVFRGYLYLPDPLVFWAPLATISALAEIRRRKIRAIVTSCPAFSTNLVGLTVKRVTGIPWVADFRDLWVGRPYRQRSRLQARIEPILERIVVAHADRIVIGSPRWRETFTRRYGEWISSKIICITNGYDGYDLRRAEPLASEADADLIRIVYTGGIYEPASPGPLLRALGELARDSAEIRRRVRVILAGPWEESEKSNLDSIAGEYGLTENLEYRGVMTHRDTLRLQRSASILLLSLKRGHKDTISGKSYEYMATGKPILALVAMDGVQAEILRPSGLAVCVEHGDVEGTRKALEKLLGEIREGRTSASPDTSYIAGFELKGLAGQLAALLDELDEGRHARKTRSRSRTSPLLRP